MPRSVAGLPAVVLALSSACVLDVPVGTLTDAGTGPSPARRSANVDVLLVIDNSGSMCAEHRALLDAFFGPDCPIQELDNPGPYLNPSPAQAAELEQTCGLAQMLAAYDQNFRIGIITTDVGPCDNRYGYAAQDIELINCYGEAVDWGRRPQRGCLQTGPSWNGRWLGPGDGALQYLFREGLENIGTFGSPFERGLDAVDIFLDQDPDKLTAPGCARDGEAFLRPDAQLMLVFVTDEDDCSHGDGAFGLPDENVGELCSHEVEESYRVGQPDALPSRCYTESDSLVPVGDFVARWQARRPAGISVFVLAGVEGGGKLAASCLAGTGGALTSSCFESQGSSDQDGPGQYCDPARLADEGIDEPCCTADGAKRYAELARALGDAADGASICGDFGGALKRVRLLLP